MKEAILIQLEAEWKAAYRDWREMPEPSIFDPIQNRTLKNSCRMYMRLRARRIVALLTPNLSRQRVAGIEWRYMHSSGGNWIEQTTDEGFLRVTNNPDAVNGICGFGDLEETDSIDHLNADFIAHSKQDIFVLLNEIARLRWQLENEEDNAVYASFLESDASADQLKRAQSRLDAWLLKRGERSRASDWMASAEVAKPEQWQPEDKK